jgi:hypothetical protein
MGPDEPPALCHQPTVSAGPSNQGLKKAKLTDHAFSCPSPAANAAGE